MSYSKCGLCLQDLEVIKPASGIAYIRCSNWKECPFFCPEESIHVYQQCVCDRVIPEYKVCEGGKSLLSKSVYPKHTIFIRAQKLYSVTLIQERKITKEEGSAT